MLSSSERERESGKTKWGSFDRQNMLLSLVNVDGRLSKKHLLSIQEKAMRY